MKVALIVLLLALGQASAAGRVDLLASHKLGLLQLGRFFEKVIENAADLQLKLK